MTDTEIKSVLTSNYPFEKISQLELLNGGVSNENYVFAAGNQKYVARVCLFEPENQLQAMIPFLKHAVEMDYPASRIMQTNEGDDFVRFNDTPIIVTTYLEGNTVDPAKITKQHLISLARLVADFHKLNWEPINTPITLDPDYIFNVYEELQNYSPDGNENIVRLIELVDIYYKKFNEEKFSDLAKQLPHGLAHGDIIPGNVLFQDDEAVSLLDFEELGTSWQLQDVAMILDTWTHQNGTLTKDYIELFLNEYNSLKPLTQIEQDNIENAMKFIAFRQCVYAKQMLFHGKISSVDNFSSYWALLYLHENGLDL